MSRAAEAGALPGACEVAVVGAGPAGLAVATALKQHGLDSVLVLEREPAAGGIPRHCGHPPFGMREFHRCLTGPRYADELTARARAAGVEIRLETTVVELAPGGELHLSTPGGETALNARRVVLCTGVRETPRAARLVSGQRPLGIVTTGALQSMVYLSGTIPFTRPVIVGSELVSFSALLTCRHAGIRPRAMLEEQPRIAARTAVAGLATLLRVPLRRNTRLLEIIGAGRVSAVRTRDASGAERRIDCDGVLFSGGFTPEASLLRMSHLAVDPGSGGPVIDQFGRCSDPAYFAAGNLLRPVETAGWCWREGRRCATAVLASLAGGLPAPELALDLARHGEALEFALPQRLYPARHSAGARYLQVRFARRACGELSLQHNGRVLWRKRLRALPQRRVLVPLAKIAGPPTGAALTLRFTESP